MVHEALLGRSRSVSFCSPPTRTTVWRSVCGASGTSAKRSTRTPLRRSRLWTSSRRRWIWLPHSARERLNYGLALLRAGKTKEGVDELLKVQKQDPAATAYLVQPRHRVSQGRRRGKGHAAVRAHDRNWFRTSPSRTTTWERCTNRPARSTKRSSSSRAPRELDPNLAAPHFQLYNVYRQQGKKEQAAKELAEFQRLKKLQEGSATPEDMEWSDYAEIYDPIDIKGWARARPGSALRAAPRGRPGNSPMRGHDVLTWNQDGLTLLHNGTEPVKDSGLGGVHDVISAAAGDFDNDGLSDLCVLTEQGPLLFHNVKGKFEKFAAELAVRPVRARDLARLRSRLRSGSAAAGREAGAAAQSGTRPDSPTTRKDFPFVPGHALDATLFRW